MSFLDKWYDRFFDRRGSYIFARRDHLEEYSALINKVHPYFIIAYHLAGDIQGGTSSPDNAILFAERIHSCVYKRDDFSKYYADNHNHLSGGDFFLATLDTIIAEKIPNSLLSRKKSSKYQESLAKLPLIPEFDSINAHVIDLGTISELLQATSSILHEYIINNKINDKDPSQILHEICLDGCGKLFKDYDYRIASIKQYMSLCGDEDEHILFKCYRTYWMEERYDQAYFVFFVIIFLIFKKNNQNSHISRYIRIYIQCVNILRSYATMSTGHGLTCFTKFFDSDIRKRANENKKHVTGIRNMINAGTTHAELKISPKDIISESFLPIVRACENAFLEENVHNPEFR